VSERPRFDVVVVGGGCAGVAAALEAADFGARTLLVERADELGGNVSQAFVHTICGLHLADRERPEPANPGRPMEFVRGLVALGAAGEPERQGRVFVLPIRPSGLAAHARARCEAARELTLWTGARVVEARLAGTAGDESELRVVRGGDDGPAAWVGGSCVVDTSGEGALAALGGADFELAPPDRLQASSYIFALEGVPAAELEGFSRMKLSVSVARAARDGALPEACESILLRPGDAPGEAHATLGMPPLPGRPYAPTDADYCEQLAECGRERAERIAVFLAETRPGFEGCRISRLPARVGVREGRRLRGLRVLDADSVLAGRLEARDEVARSAWPIELWDDHQRARIQHAQGPCSIPLGALVSASHPRLGMAGRCLSATHEALGALRVIGTALATGAAIGRASALAVESGCALGDVDPASVRPAALGDAA
jgi:hypothetical protein